MDRRRLPMPERSVPWQHLVKVQDAVKASKETTAKETTTKETPLLTTTGIRADARTIDEPRPLFLRTGLISRANGSAYVESARVKVAVAVYGPRPSVRKETFSERGRVQCEFRYATFAREVRAGFAPGAEERASGVAVERALEPAVRLELYPKSVVDVVVTVLEADGSAASLSAAIVGASIALADAGIEMLDLVVASSVSFHAPATASSKLPLTLVDATFDEERRQAGWLIVASMPSLNEITHVVEQGHAEVAQLTAALERSMEHGTRIYAAMSQYLGETLASSDATDTGAKRNNKRQKQ